MTLPSQSSEACDACGQIGEHSSLCRLAALEAEVERLRQVLDNEAERYLRTGYFTDAQRLRQLLGDEELGMKE